jgi:heme/copper-type cytochrome/quinol oxidase subunit 4
MNPDITTEMVKSIIFGIVRNGLSAAATWMISRKYLTSDQASWLIMGIATIAVNLVFVIWAHIRKAKFLQAAMEATPGTSLAQVKDAA